MSISLKHPLSLIASSNPQKHRFQLVAFSLLTILISILGMGVILIVLEFDATHFKQYVPERSIQKTTAGGLEMSDSIYFRHQLDLAAIAQGEKEGFPGILSEDLPGGAIEPVIAHADSNTRI